MLFDTTERDSRFDRKDKRRQLDADRAIDGLPYMPRISAACEGYKELVEKPAGFAPVAAI